MADHHQNTNKIDKGGAVAYIIGNIIGVGIFITPTSVLSQVHSVGASLVIWLISAVVSCLGAYCFLELGTSIRKDGADYAYLQFAGWNRIAFTFMSGACLLTFPLNVAIQSEALSEYFLQGVGVSFCDDTAAFAARKLIGFSVIWLLLYANFFSLAHVVARLQIVASSAKILSMVILIVAGLYYLFFLGRTENLSQPFANSTLHPAQVVNAFFSGLYSYDGWDILSFGIESIRDPKSSMAFAVPVGMSVVALLYLLVNFSYFVVLSVPQMLESGAVASTFAREALGDFHYALPFLICIVLIGSTNCSLFSSSRYLYAAARARQMPSFIACISQEHDSPRAALFFHLLLAICFSFLGNANELISYGGFCIWLQRAFTMSALLYIRLTRREVHPGAIRTPLFIPIIFWGVCLALVGVTIVQDTCTSYMGLLILTIGLALNFLFISDHSLRRFNSYNKCADWINEKACVLAQIIFDGVIVLSNEEEALSASPPRSPINGGGGEEGVKKGR